MNGTKMAENLIKLRDVKKIKDVKPLSNAIFPGYHCPLMGAMLTIKEIKDAVMMVIGPDECTYYTKMATGRIKELAEGQTSPIVSLVLDSHDVTFGCREKLEEAFEELVEEYKPKTVFLVTTCVVEVIGDDIDSMAEVLADKYGFPIEVVHAENFKTDDHLPGIQDTMTVSVNLMEEQECNGSVNILGQRLGSFNRTEVFRILKEAGVPKGLQIPGQCSLDDIKKAPAAKVNIVVHPIGLPLAKKMKSRFGIPYVVFERVSNPENIYKAYKELFEALEKPLPEEVNTLYKSAKEQEEVVKNSIEKMSYFSGNTALSNYELHSYLTELGFEPLLIQTSEIPPADNPYLKEILEKSDPYVTRAANIGPLKYIYEVLKPDMNIGAGNSQEIEKNKIARFMLPNAYNTLGFEVNSMVLNAALNAYKEMQFLKGGHKDELM